ncbi:MAG TPA: hypothetical protein VH277_05585 [Gemmatimonadaceae bacterium]|nr:hypothetical protein [Gemmatimonadaceae bacterium]
MVPGVLVLSLAAGAAAQGPSWCTTGAVRGRVFQGCGIAASRDESARQAYGEIARLLQSRIEVKARTAQGADVTRASTQLSRDRQGHPQRTTSYDSAAYEVRLQSDVALRGLKQRQESSHGRFYTLLTYDAAPDLNAIDAALLQANAALMQGELAAGIAACRHVSALTESSPWLAGLTVFEPDCANIVDVLDSRLHVSLLDGGTARITYDEAPVSGAFLVAQRGANGAGGALERGIGPSNAAGIVELPAAETFAGVGSPRELLDVDWSRLGVAMLPFRARASRRLSAADIALSAVLDASDDPLLLRSALFELQSQLHVDVETAGSDQPPLSPAADGGRTWRLMVSGTSRDVAAVFGGESVASASMRWTVVDVRSGRQVGAGAVVDQRGTAGDGVAAREAAVRLAVRRVVSDVERLAARK